MSKGPIVLMYLLLLILPIAALAARRMPAQTIIKMAAIWIVIFGAGAAVFQLIS